MSSEEDVVLVLGSDGIFDVLSDAEAKVLVSGQFTLITRFLYGSYIL